MKKKNFLALSMAACLAFSCLTGCELVTTDNERDMAQVVADIDIAKSDVFKDGQFAKYTEVIGKETVSKREMITYFINVGYTYIQSYGYSYAQTFEIVLSSLVNQKILGQYAKAYYLDLSEKSADYNFTMADYQAYVNKAADVDREIASYRYFLTDDEYGQAVYSLESSINTTLDSYERQYINAESETNNVSVRTLPKGAEAEKEDYYDKDYTIYTGKNAVTACGSYEKVDGSTPATRKKAYNRFLLSLQNNYLYSKSEQGLALQELKYYKTELARQLSSRLISKLADTIEDEAAKNLTETYVTARYNELMQGQKNSFGASNSVFEDALNSIGDDSFVLYAPSKGYGFVLNILLPFSATQSYLLSGYQADNTLSIDEYYTKRASLLKNLTATDKRDTWFLGETDYSYEATDAYQGNGYLFFENSFDKDSDKYEAMSNYYGKYAFNGKVEKDADDDYIITPNKITIDDFIADMEGYVSFATGASSKVIIDKQADYYTRSNVDDRENVDYSSFVYYAGKFDLDFNPNEVFLQGTKTYDAFAAVNELSFAYNTDTAGLNSYLGYAVSAYNTNFVKEFEYAAKLAVENGVGSYTVAPSDYGWHIMYCTFVFEEGETYTFDYSEIEKEGTFSYYFYEALKSSTSGTASNSWQTKVINTFNNDTCVEKHADRYEDLLKLG